MYVYEWYTVYEHVNTAIYLQFLNILTCVYLHISASPTSNLSHVDVVRVHASYDLHDACDLDARMINVFFTQEFAILVTVTRSKSL